MNTKTSKVVLGGIEFKFRGKHCPKVFRGFGEINQFGKKHPILWAVDDQGLCWVNKGKGDRLRRSWSSILLNLTGLEFETNEIRRALGIKLALPSWAQQALAFGWTPPNTFNLQQYQHNR